MREGGGIGFTVGQTKLATDEELLSLLIERLTRMLQAGKITLIDYIDQHDDQDD